MIDEKIGKNCTGCSTCFNICPYNSIDMKENKEGFFYPKVNLEKCKRCGICIKTCPVLNKNCQRGQIKEKMYAAYSKDENNRLISSSGGCFGEIAKTILEEKGIVFGAGYDENFNVVHMLINKKEDLEKIQGSKYVQSKINKTFIEIKELLEKNIIILFSGTPCQIAGLKIFLGKDYTNLYTIDIICHGVPSQKVFDKYLEQYKDKKCIKDIKFRDKTYGWKKYSMKIILKNKKEDIRIAGQDDFIRAFLSNLSLRESCYNCNFKKSKADITIGDFWGINNIMPELNDDKGISILTIHTDKGKKIIEKCKNNMIMREIVNKSEIIKYNPCIEKSAKRPKKRDQFFIDINKVDFPNAVKSNVSRKNLFKKAIKKILSYKSKVIK